MNKAEQETVAPPPPEEILYATNYTIEALAARLGRGGGMFISNDEASSFFSGQNQYKSKGNDREEMLKIYDGKSLKNLRVSKTIGLKGSRISIAGGTQPGTFAKIFQGEKIFQTDGTLFRFMMTYAGEQFYPMTKTSWNHKNQGDWSNIIHRAFAFRSKWVEYGNDCPLLIEFTEEALEHFIDFSNDLGSQKNSFPAPLRGYIKKISGWAARLAGVIKCLEAFSLEQKPGGVISVDDLEKGIQVAKFYMSHNIKVFKTLSKENYLPPVEYTDQQKHLGMVLESLKGDLDCGRLAIAHIFKKYTATAGGTTSLKSSRVLSSIIKSCGLNMPQKRASANGYKNYSCLIWDAKVEKFIENVRPLATFATNIEKNGSPKVENKNEFATFATNGGKRMAKQKPVVTSGNTGMMGEVAKVACFSGKNGKEDDTIII